MLADLGQCSVFTKIDKIENFFLTTRVGRKVTRILYIKYSLGRYKPKRVAYGIASYSAIWQQTMDKLFNALPSVFCFVDGILVAS